MKECEKPLHLMLEGGGAVQPLEDVLPDDVDGGGSGCEDENDQGDLGDSDHEVDDAVEPPVSGNSSSSSSRSSSSSSSSSTSSDSDGDSSGEKDHGLGRRQLKPPNHYWGSYTFIYKGVT